MMKRRISFLGLILLMVVLIGCNKKQDTNSEVKLESDKVAVWFVSSQEIVYEGNKFLIQYKYDSEGNEISRIVCDELGQENEKYLKLYYDEVRMPRGYWKKKTDGTSLQYEKDGVKIEYDQNGNLISYFGDDDNYITYKYIKIEVSEEKEKQIVELNKKLNGVDENGNIITLKDKVLGGSDVIIVDYEEYSNMLWGETGALVWKNYNDEYYFFTIAKEPSEKLYLAGNDGTAAGYDKLGGEVYCKQDELVDVKHMGDDTFLITLYLNNEYFEYKINSNAEIIFVRKYT